MIGATLSGYTSGRFLVTEVRKFGKELKLKIGDIIESVNGKDVFDSNLDEVSCEFERTVKPGDEVTVNVLRKDNNGNFQKKSLKAKTYMVKITEQNKIIPLVEPDTEQLMIRKAWLNQ
jgi:C-terminal processing protease CtpA/Prc